MNSGALKSFVASRRIALVCLALAAATFAVYWQVSGFEFTNFDEFQMVLSNPFVLGGVTLQGLSWALTTSWFEYWHPLTWLSHMLDCELFGPSPGWHHLVSLGFHVANTLLLFAVLQRMTGALWRSAMVAALFALHPLHVESVAWIAERKDVLSAFFFMLTLWAYVRYAEVQSPKSKVQSQETALGIQQPPSRITFHVSHITHHAPLRFWYWTAVFMFACGLMSKPMVVTLPFVLLLLDYWPLRRLSFPPLPHSPTPLLRLIWEKLPFFALTIVSCIISYWGAKAGGNILSAGAVPWGLRLANVPVSYARYLGKLFWPTDLIALYPMPSHWSWWQVGGAVLVLVLISLVAVRRARSAPYLIVGWLLFLGILFPTIGFIQVGFQSIADRYTYIPAIGIFIAVVWGAAEWAGGNHRWTQMDTDKPGNGGENHEIHETHEKGIACQKDTAHPSGEHLDCGRSLSFRVFRGSNRASALLGGLAVVVLVLCGYLTWVQAGYWRNSTALWTHCLAVCPDNVFAHYNLGYVLQHSNRTGEAMEHYRTVLRLKPDHPDANLNLGIALIGTSHAQEATNYLAAALRAKPGYARAEGALGLALLELGDYAGAVSHCGEAIRLEPDTFGPYVDMGRALSAQGKSDDALRNYAEGLRLNPGFPPTHYYLGMEWMKRGAFEQAASSFGEAVRLAPTWAEARAQQQLALSEAEKPQMNTDAHR